MEPKWAPCNGPQKRSMGLAFDVHVCVQTCSWATLMTAKYWGHLDTAQAQKGGWVREDLVAPCHSITMGSVSVSCAKLPNSR